MLKRNAMSDALRAKKARGLDLTIVIGGAEPINGTDEEQLMQQKELGVAPEASPVEVGHPDEMQDKQLIEQELAKMGKGTLAHKAMMMKK